MSVARKLIVIPEAPSRIEGAVRIDASYPRMYTEAEMRQWAVDTERLLNTPPAAIERLRTMGRDRLTPEERVVARVYDEYFVDPSRGIKGSLRDDGVVELDGGRHRAAYLIERGVDVPVWVSTPDQGRLDAYANRCARDRAAREAGRGGDARIEESRRPLDREKRHERPEGRTR